MVELKPCPFCGGKAEITQLGSMRQSTIVACEYCGCSLETGEVFNPGERWNERHSLAAPVGGWLDISTAPKKGTFLAAIHHGSCGYMIVEAKRIGTGVHHVAEDSCVGWRPGHEHPAYWQPLPSPPEPSHA